MSTINELSPMEMMSPLDQRGVLIDVAQESFDSYTERLQQLGPESQDRRDFRDHAERVVRLTEATVGGLVPEELYFAAVFHDIVDRLYEDSSKNTPERQAAAARAILELLSHPALREDQADYLQGVMADFREVERASEKYRKSMAKDVANGSMSSDVVKMISDKYSGRIPPDVFKKTQPMMDFEHMSEVSHRVHIAALMVKALELYDNMRHPSSLRESALLQDVLEAESFYAPICEVLGLDGVAAMLRSQASRIRLVKQGLSCNVGRAEAKMDSLNKVGPERAMRVVFGDSYDFTTTRVVGRLDNGEYPVHIGEFAAAGGEMSFAGNWRFKTAGSLARKLNSEASTDWSEAENDMPMDLFGMMVIADNNESMADSFVHFLKKRQKQIALRPAPSKEKAIIVQGSRKYAALLATKLREAGIDESLVQYKTQSKKEAKTRGYKQYEVSKVTFIAHDKLTNVDIPTEIQFVTKAERERSRLAEVAHIIYKYIDQLPEKPTRKETLRIIASAKKVLNDVYAQKGHLNPHSLGANKQTLARGEEMITRALKVYEQSNNTSMLQ